MKAIPPLGFYPTSFRRDLAFILGFNAVLLIFLKSGPTGQFGLVTQTLLIVGPFATLLGTGLRGLTWPPWREDRSTLFIAAAVILFAAGQFVTIDRIIVGHSPPVPSTADLFRLAGYLLAVAAILTLPMRRIPQVVRGRIILDGLMFLAASMTVSWYFIIGPAWLPASTSALQLFLANAYPGGDTLLLLSLVFLAFQLRERRLRLTFILFVLCFIAITVADTIYNRQLLDGSFAADGFVNIGWTLGWMFGVLGAAASGQIPDADQPSFPKTNGAVGEWSVWRSVHPFVLVPVIGGLFFYAWQVDARSPLIDGVALGFGALLLIVLLREVLVEIENGRLYRDLVATNSRLAALATIDPLTDLPNHRTLVDVVDAEIERSKRFRRPFAILFCDLDHFKALNDTHGHAAGDAALRYFGQLVRRSIRATDVVGRWGGEEFLIILPELDTRSAALLAERLRVMLSAQDDELKGQQLTCSIGVAMYPTDGLTRDAVIDAADLAMYAAKTLGRDQVRTAADPAVTELGATDTGHR